MKHPGPWSIKAFAQGTSMEEVHTIVDANGGDVARAYGDDGYHAIAFETDEIRRLILAAPVLLEGMRALLSDDGPRDITPFNLLVAWLDGEPGANRVNLDGFMQWLKTGKGAVIG